MHPEMYLPLHLMVERELDERVRAERRLQRPDLPMGGGSRRVGLAARIRRAAAALQAAAAPSSCCAMA